MILRSLLTKSTPYASTKEPFMSAKKTLYIRKKLCISAKELYTSAKGEEGGWFRPQYTG